MIHSVTRREFLRLTSLLTVGASLIPQKIFANEILPLKEIKRTAFTMGSIVTFTVYHEDEHLSNIAIDETIKEMKTIDKLMSVFNSNSQLSLVNRHSYQQEISVDFRIIEVLEHAKKFHLVTQGAFDVTIEPLMKLFGFRDDKLLCHFPTDKQISDVLHCVGQHNVEISNQQFYPPQAGKAISINNPLTKLDFGGIAVGYAIDRAVNILRNYGIESALINHSGDIYALGTPPEEDAWEVGIVDPQNTEEIITTVKIKNQALSTSGNYQNFVELDGKRIGHLIDPRIGKIASSILSGTTVASTAIETDALSTGLFVLGAEEIKSVIPKMQNVQFIVIQKTPNGEVITQL